MKLTIIFILVITVISCNSTSIIIDTNAINSKNQNYDNGTRDSIYISKNGKEKYIEFINSKGYNKTIVINNTKNTVIREMFKFHNKKIASIYYSDNGNIKEIYYYYGNDLKCEGQINFIFKLNNSGKIIEESYGVCISDLIENENGELTIPRLRWNNITFNVENHLRKEDIK